MKAKEIQKIAKKISKLENKRDRLRSLTEGVELKVKVSMPDKKIEVDKSDKSGAIDSCESMHDLIRKHIHVMTFYGEKNNRKPYEKIELSTKESTELLSREIRKIDKAIVKLKDKITKSI